jgi:NAD(P)-dependent dehydrogenase (short-subunit alcohol dehydrogenase family)
VNVGSELGIRPVSGLAVYASTKAAVIHLTKALAKDFNASKVRVNCICPGPVDTPMLNRSIARTKNPRREMQETITSTLLGRLAKPSEIAKAIEFMLSPDAGYMTGSVVVVDGGATI